MPGTPSPKKRKLKLNVRNLFPCNYGVRERRIPNDATERPRRLFRLTVCESFPEFPRLPWNTRAQPIPRCLLLIPILHPGPAEGCRSVRVQGVSPLGGVSRYISDFMSKKNTFCIEKRNIAVSSVFSWVLCLANLPLHLSQKCLYTAFPVLDESIPRSDFPFCK